MAIELFGESRYSQNKGGTTGGGFLLVLYIITFDCQVFRAVVVVAVVVVAVAVVVVVVVDLPRLA